MEGFVFSTEYKAFYDILDDRVVRWMLLDCQLKSLLKNYLKTIIVGFGQADALGLSVRNNLLPSV